MSVKRAFLIILLTCAVMVTLRDGRTLARSLNRQPDPTDGVVPYPDRVAGEAGLGLLELGAASAAGNPIGANFPISSVPSYDAQHASVAYNSQREEYLVVWANNRPVNDEIVGQRVARDGTFLGTEFFIAAGPGGERQAPDVAYNSQRDEYVVVWEGEGNIQAQRVPGQGGTVGSEWTIALGSSSVYYEQPAVAYAFTKDRYVVVFRHLDVTWGGSGIYFDVREWDLSPLVQNAVEPVSAATVPEGPDLAYNRARNEVLVVWQQWMGGPGGSYDIYGRRVTVADPLPSVVGATFPIAQYGNEETSPAVAAIPHPVDVGQYLVVWEFGVCGVSHIDGQMVTGLGALQGYSIDIAGSCQGSDPDLTDPAVASNEGAGRYLVAWTHNWAGLPDYIIQARAVAGEGAPVGGPVSVGGLSGKYAAVADGPLGDFLMVYDDSPPPASTRDVFGRFWGCRTYLPLVIRNLG
jgi:hypothetical protein